jgi:hypothetical protein
MCWTCRCENAGMIRSQARQTPPDTGSSPSDASARRARKDVSDGTTGQNGRSATVSDDRFSL